MLVRQFSRRFHGAQRGYGGYFAPFEAGATGGDELRLSAPPDGAHAAAQELETRTLLAGDTYQIVESQLQILGGIGGHNLLVVLNPQGNPIAELDGWATGADKEPVDLVIALLPWTLTLQVYNTLNNYNAAQPQVPLYSGTYEDVMNRWDSALAGMAQINQENLYYPMLGLGENSNSVASTEIRLMGLTELPIPNEALLVPGRGSILLSDQVISSDLQQHNIAPPAAGPDETLKSESGQLNADGTFTLTSLFTDGSRDVETDTSGAAAETMYAADGSIATDVTYDGDSVDVNQHLDAFSSAILTESYSVDSQGDVDGDPTIQYQKNGQAFSADQIASQLGSGFASLLVNSSSPAVQIAAKAPGSGISRRRSTGSRTRWHPCSIRRLARLPAPRMASTWCLAIPSAVLPMRLRRHC